METLQNIEDKQMKTITIQLNKIKPNPFKKFIKDGELDEEVISKLMEGYEQTTFHVNFKARNNNNEDVELIYGHHRLEAAKRFFGEKHEIKLDVYSYDEFSDEKMLLDMVRENLTQRGEDYKDMADSVIIAKKWLKGELKFDKKLKTEPKPLTVGAKEIAQFLSSNGKTISQAQVRKYLAIEEKLHQDLKDKVGRGTRSGAVDEGKIGFEVASELAGFDKSEQKMLHKHLEKAEVNKDKARKMLVEYKHASKEIKQEVKRGKIKLEDVPIEKFKAKIKEKAEKFKKKDLKSKDLKKFIREGENLIGTTNAEIFKTCVFFEGLAKTKLIHKLDWNTIYDMLETAKKGGNQYAKFVNKIMENI